MNKELLLEIGMEEVPARFVRGAVEQLSDKLGKWLKDSRIGFAGMRSFATPRRIAVLVEGVADRQEDLDEEAKGPSRKIALDDSGAWSKAALGFARSQGVDPSELYFKELAGVEYVHARKRSAGQDTGSLLSQGLEQLIVSMAFPKNMRWGSRDLRFVRPIRWLTALYGGDVVPLEIAGVKSGNVTRGHRFLGSDTAISAPSEYEARLKEQYVYADIEERRQLILKQIGELSRRQGWTIAVKDDLLEEVTFLVEYPTVLFGTFDPQFLQIPQEVLITSMREHQRYFPVLDERGQLLPYFVTVRNGNEQGLDRVARGNEKVLRARLSDARFFYEEDQKMEIGSALKRLETVVFQEELGTVADKVRRITAIADALAVRLGVAGGVRSTVNRAASLCKFDLVTQMVYEFPELQGLMGEDYARKAGEPEEVAKAMFEHYQPRFSGDASPASLIGAIVSVADKIDTIVGCFSVGIVPTGSQDPYALRRQAAGIVQIMLDRSLSIGLSDLFDSALDVHAKAGLLKRNGSEIRTTLYDFFSLRVKNLLAERQVCYDIADAVMAAGFERIGSVIRRAEILAEESRGAGFKSAVESFTRTANLASKGASAEVDPALFEDPAERSLYEAWKSVHDRFDLGMREGREADSMQALKELEAPITRFFDAVMVMAEDVRIRENRLGLLASIAADAGRFADFSKLVLQ